jgi:hypothetical protein
MSMALVAGAVLLMALMPPAFRKDDVWGVPEQVPEEFIALGTASLGRVAAAPGPANPIGSLPSTCDLLFDLGGSAHAYATYRRLSAPARSPARGSGLWWIARAPNAIFLMVALVPLVSPTGRSPSLACAPECGSAPCCRSSGPAYAFARRLSIWTAVRLHAAQPAQPERRVGRVVLLRLRESSPAVLAPVAFQTRARCWSGSAGRGDC